MALSPEENGVRTELGQLAVGLYDFEGVRDDNLPFKKGEVIVIQEMNESGWWKGVNSAGRVGIFPYNYVNATDVKHINYRIVKAIVSFTGVDDNMLSFEVGDKITILKPVDQDWSFGRIHSLKADPTNRLKERIAGKFPLDHVEETKDIDGLAASDEEEFAAQQKYLKQKEAQRMQEERRKAEEEAIRAFEEEQQRAKETEMETLRKEQSNLVRQKEREKAKLENEVETMKRKLRKIEEEALVARRRAEKAEEELEAAKAEQERLRIAKEEREAEHDEMALSRQMHRAKFVNDKMNQSFVKYKKSDGFESPGPAPQQQKATVRSVASKFSKLGQGGSRCKACNKLVGGFGPNQMKALGEAWHRDCFRCGTCSKVLRSGEWLEHDGHPYCTPCHRKGFGARGFGFGGAMAGNYTV